MIIFSFSTFESKVKKLFPNILGNDFKTQKKITQLVLCACTMYLYNMDRDSFLFNDLEDLRLIVTV